MDRARLQSEAAILDAVSAVPGLTIAQLRGKHDRDKCMDLVLVFPMARPVPALSLSDAIDRG